MSMTETSATHPAIRGLVQRRGMPANAVRKDHSLVLNIDGKYRVRMRPASDRRLALQAKVLAVPGGDRSSDQAIARLMGHAAGMLRDYASTLSFNQRTHEVQLEQVLPADISDVQLDAELAEFVNALSFWVRVGKSL
jgi:hypothetical protein